MQIIVSLGFGRWALEALMISSVVPTSQPYVRDNRLPPCRTLS